VISQPRFLAPEKFELAFVFGMREQRIAGLPGERLEILYRPGVGGQDAQHLAGSHIGEGFFCAQDGQRAVEPAGIEVFVKVHARSGCACCKS
jgi:hypothetical protein